MNPAGRSLASKPKSRAVQIVDAEQVAELAVERQPELEPGPQDAEVAEEDRSSTSRGTARKNQV